MSAQPTILITGGNGFLGKNLIKVLKAKKFKIISVSRSTKIPGVINIQEDLTRADFQFLKKVRPDYVIYLGTISSPKQAKGREQECFNSNVKAIQKFLEIAKDLPLKKIILMSSIVLYKDKENGLYSEGDDLDIYKDIYSLSKYFLENLAEFYRKEFNLPITVFRLSNTYGAFQELETSFTLIPQLIGQALKNKEIEVWNTKPVRDWVFVDDVVKVLIKELKTKEGGLFNLGTGIGTSVKEIVEEISKLSRVSVTNLNKPASPPLKIICNMSKLEKHLGFVPKTPVVLGLKKTHVYYQKKN